LMNDTDMNGLESLVWDAVLDERIDWFPLHKVVFVGKLIAVVVPNLNSFNVQAAVDAGNSIPIIYLAAAFNYLVVFVIAIWMVAMLLFEDRDLA
ncbi:MAG: hypothetical protein AAF539_03335, partial [Planctomycetota bacterium]